MSNIKTPEQLLELLKDPAAWKAWFNSLTEERKQMIETLVAEYKARAVQDKEVS